MRRFFLGLLGAVTLGLGASAPIAAQPGARDERPAELVEALRAANIAEVYIVRRDIEFVVTPNAGTVKTLGCRYVFSRISRAWDALEAALQDVEFQADEERRWPPGVRLGLLLGDDRGSLFEVYARWPGESEAFVPGIVQRHSARISARFAAALEGVTLSHPENMVRIESPMRLCPPGRAEIERR
jgi:hypothetical protein